MACGRREARRQRPLAASDVTEQVVALRALESRPALVFARNTVHAVVLAALDRQVRNSDTTCAVELLLCLRSEEERNRVDHPGSGPGKVLGGRR